MLKRCKQLLSLLLCSLVLAACSTGAGPDAVGSDSSSPHNDPQLFTVGCSLGDSQDTLDPAMATAAGSETILLHLYENLMTWEDDGSGFARVTYGQAESFSLETDYTGNATYSFMLRDDIYWSDGQPVTARDFVASWRRLADPATASPHSRMLEMVSGYDQVQATGDPSLLSVSAPSDHTFMVTLSGSCAYFLEEICASAYTMPVRTDLAEDVAWSQLTEETIPEQVVTNGPYVLSQFSHDRVTLESSDSYYQTRRGTPDVIYFQPAGDTEGDYAAFREEGSPISLVTNLPASALDELCTDGMWTPEPVTATYGVLINTLQPPFDDPAVRRAFSLAIDPQAVTEAIGSAVYRPAAGLVPYGVTDFGLRSSAEDSAKATTLPDPNAPLTPQTPVIYWDFRIHSQELVTQATTTDYDANCLQAKALMAQAGYAGGGSFPVVEYIYIESAENRAAALALQSMWKEQLGVTVTVRGLEQTEYDAMLCPAVPDEPQPDEDAVSAAAYQMAGADFTAACSDAAAFLAPWHSGSENNCTGYRSSAFDILLDSARDAVSFEARDAYLHDAEAILLADAGVIPLFHRGGSYQLSPSLTGLYRAPDGVFFLSSLSRKAE